MPCYARWIVDYNSGLIFRDQTILQFGKSWNLLANYILLNPGRATPINSIMQNEFLESKSLFFYSNIKGFSYYEFNIDQLMSYILKFYSSSKDGGVIKIYNLFNLKNQISHKAIEQYKIHRNNPYMHTDVDEIKFGNAPIIIACGQNISAHENLITELKKYISLIDINQLYALNKIREKTFAVVKPFLNQNGILESYHPSYTFKYGNTTLISGIP